MVEMEPFNWEYVGYGQEPAIQIGNIAAYNHFEHSNWCEAYNHAYHTCEKCYIDMYIKTTYMYVDIILIHEAHYL